MKSTDKIEQFIRETRATTRPALDALIIADALAAMRQPAQQTDIPVRQGGWVRRIIMGNRLVRFAGAAAALLLVALGVWWLTLSPSNVGPAYAFSQTVEAMRGIRTLHVRDTNLDPKQGEEPTKEFWMEFDGSGKMIRCRGVMPKTEDGAKEFTVLDGKATIWFKDKNSLLIMKEPGKVRQIEQLAIFCNPKGLIEGWQKAQEDGTGKINIEESTGKPTVVTMDYADKSKEPGRREVLHVDASTGLATEMQWFSRNPDGTYVEKERMEFLDCNKPLDEAVFELKPGKDVIVVDQTKEVGLAQGNND